MEPASIYVINDVLLTDSAWFSLQMKVQDDSDRDNSHIYR